MRWLLVASVTFLSLAIRLYQIGRQSYWLDEMFSLNVAMVPDLKALFWDNHPPLYHVLLKPWVALFGTSETATRSLSAIFSALGTGYLALWGTQKGKLYGVSLALIHCILPVSIVYGQETRMYALFELLSIIQVTAFLDLCDHPARQRAIRRFSWVTLPLLATHYLAFLLLAIELGILLLRFGTRSYRKLLLGIAALAGGIAIYFSLTFESRFLLWQNLKYAYEPESRSPFPVLKSLLLGSPYAAPLIFGLLLPSVRTFRNKRHSRSLDLAAIFAGAILVAWVGSLIFHKSIFLDRYFVFLIPVVLIFIVESIHEMNRFGDKKWLLVLPFLVLTAVNTPSAFQVRKAPWRQFARMTEGDHSSIVLTTRSLALRYPYFQNRNTDVESLLNTASPPDRIAELLKSHETVWIVENFFGGIAYMGDLKDELIRRGFKVSDQTLQDEESEPLLIMKITMKP